MAGLFDWLSDAMGGGSSMSNPMGDMSGMPMGAPMGPPPGMPPVQSLETAPPPMPPISGPQNHEPMMQPPGAAPPISGPQNHEPYAPSNYPAAGDPMLAGGPTPNGPGLPPSAPFPPGGDPMTAGGPVPNGPGLSPPMPAPRPGGALPPGATPTGGDIPMNPPPVMMAPPGGAGGDGSTALSRALGLDPNRARAAVGGLGAGLKAAGDNAHKPGLAAFSGSAGSAMEGSQKTDDKTFEKQDKYLAKAIAAKKAGNDAEYNQNYLRYQIEATKARLKASTEKATSASVVNSPEQLYLRAVGATNSDASVKITANSVREAQKQFGAGSKEAKDAIAAHEKQIETVRNGHFSTLGIDPKSVKGLESKEGFSDKNPVKSFPKDPAAAQKAFDALPEGAYFINPKDGRLLTKKSAGGPAAANPAQPPMTPPMPRAPAVPQLEDAE